MIFLISFFYEQLKFIIYTSCAKTEFQKFVLPNTYKDPPPHDL